VRVNHLLHTTFSATFTSLDPQGPQGVLSNTWGINVKDGGEASHTFTGDQRPKLIGTETQTNIPANDPTYGNLAWGETTWATDGTLTNGVVEADFNDVIIGTATADTITGKGGNDALAGGEGNDDIDGGDGVDVIAGGKGSDTINGGAGNDYIFSAVDLSGEAGLRKRGDDHWDLPAGSTLWAKGSTWGIARAADGTVVFPVMGATDDAPDVIDGGDGNDMVIAGRGDDFIDGGLGNDEITAGGGADVVDGGDGADFIQGDGDLNPLSITYTAVADHGDDFLDGGAGDDQVVGQGGDDTLYGGVGNDWLIGDDNRLANALPGASNGVDYLDGEDGNDAMWGDDTLTYLLHAVDAAITISVAQLRVEQSRISPVCGMASGRYACYRGPRLHRGRHAQSTHATKRTAQEVRQASTIYTANTL